MGKIPARFALAILLAAQCAASMAQYPARTITLVSSFPPGGGPDAYLRPITAKMSETLGQTVVLDSKIGAGGAIAATQVARAAPDGYTLGVSTSTLLVLKHLQPAVAFHPVDDFTQITSLIVGAPVLVVSAASDILRLDDLIAKAKVSPGKFNYGTSGIGTPSHLGAGTLNSIAQIDTVHIPFKNPADVIPALLRGDVQFSLQVTSFAVPLVRGGKLRAIATASSNRLLDLPDVPTLRELLKNDLLIQNTLLGVAAPVRTPAEILRRLHTEIVKALGDPNIRGIIEKSGVALATSASPEEYNNHWRGEFERWRQIVKLSGAKAE